MIIASVDPLLLALIGASAGLVGSGIGAGVALWIFFSDRKERRRAELSAALRGLMTALDLLALERQQQAPLKRLFSETEFGERLNVSDWLSSRMRWLTMSRIDRHIERYSVAMNRLLAVAPQDTLTLVEPANALLVDWSAPDWNERSEALRHDLVAHLRASVDPADRQSAARWRRWVQS